MLRSQLFRGNARLERCAVEPLQHIQLRDSGDFVSKIQEALVILDDAILTGPDISTQTYGPSTAEAVLAYKSGTRNIVNRSYQTAPDNIVGIMTIDRMDKEMANMEARMQEMIQRARLGAFQRIFAAFMQVVNIGPPPPPGRVDPFPAKLLRARILATAIFNNPNPDMDDIGSELRHAKPCGVALD